MLVRIKNRTDRLLIILGNSGQSIYLMPGRLSSEIDEIEVVNNPKVKKLIDSDLISVEKSGKKEIKPKKAKNLEKTVLKKRRK